MKRVTTSTAAKPLPPEDAPGRVSLRTIYAEALRDVMADPRKAIDEHDPWLASLLGARDVAPVAKG